MNSAVEAQLAELGIEGYLNQHQHNLYLDSSPVVL